MGKLRGSRQKLKRQLSENAWRSHLDEIAAGGIENVGALFGLLPLGGEISHRAAIALGRTVAEIAKTDMEGARNIVRRFMWHMNEESGNIGWGIPAAFAETLAASPELAKTFSSILVSYIMDLGHDDNFCDHDILRRECYWAVGRLAQANPALSEKARPWLLKGLDDPDAVCRGTAAWALSQLPASLMDKPALRKLADAEEEDICEIFNEEEYEKSRVSDLARMALNKPVR